MMFQSLPQTKCDCHHCEPTGPDVESYSVCEDCYVVIGTGDATGLDYHYGETESSDRLAAIEAGMDRLTAGGGYLAAGDDDYGFCRSRCECCGEHLAGNRFEALVLS